MWWEKNSIFPHSSSAVIQTNLRNPHSSCDQRLSLSQPNVSLYHNQQNAFGCQVAHPNSNLRALSILPSILDHFLFCEIRKRKPPCFQGREKQKKVQTQIQVGNLRQRASMCSVPQTPGPCDDKIIMVYQTNRKQRLQKRISL